MFFKGMRYQNFSYKKCKCVFYRRNSNRDMKTLEIGFICSLRFLGSCHEILTKYWIELLKRMRIAFIRKKYILCCVVFRIQEY